MQSGLSYYYVTTVVAMLGVLLGSQCVELCGKHPLAREGDFATCLSAWDGIWYTEIVSDGYTYDVDKLSTIAFFPAYPVLASAVSRVFGFSAVVSLLVVSHFSLLCCFVMAAAYLDARLPDQPHAHGYVLLAMGLLPWTFYFRMAYTESLFLLLTIVMLYGIQRQWPIWAIAIIVGAATGTRSVGIGLGAPLLLHIWTNAKSVTGAIRTMLLVAPLACWGLAEFMCFQWAQFGDPLAFVQTQVHWSRPGFDQKNAMQEVFRLLTLQPVWDVYDTSCDCYWGAVPPKNNPIFSMAFLNPIVFLASFATIIYGARYRLLSRSEWALGACLLILPYVMQSDRLCMMSQARFTSVIFPVYLVLGQLLARMPPPLAAAIVSCSGFLLAAYSALFVQWYWFY